MAIKCPNCKIELTPKMVGNVEIDVCENGCQGIWFDEGELHKVRHSPERDAEFDKLEGHFVPKPKEEALKDDGRMCPRCNIELYRYNWDMQSNIFLDACDTCNGIWVDGGELKGMNEYLIKMAARSVPDDAEIAAKLAAIEVQTNTKFEQDNDESLQKIVSWDVWILDDMIRFLLKKVTK